MKQISVYSYVTSNFLIFLLSFNNWYIYTAYSGMKTTYKILQDHISCIFAQLVHWNSLIQVSSSMSFWPSSLCFPKGLANDVALWFAWGTLYARSNTIISILLSNFLLNYFLIYLSGVMAFGWKRFWTVLCKVDFRMMLICVLSLM